MSTTFEGGPLGSAKGGRRRAVNPPKLVLRMLPLRQAILGCGGVEAERDGSEWQYRAGLEREYSVSSCLQPCSFSFSLALFLLPWKALWAHITAPRTASVCDRSQALPSPLSFSPSSPSSLSSVQAKHIFWRPSPFFSNFLSFPLKLRLYSFLLPFDKNK